MKAADLFDLNGRVALITGASAGLGLRFAEVLAANGLCVSLSKADAPTPVVSFAIPTLGAVGGVMITASHNPPRYNGIKLKSAYGGSATVGDTRRV